MLLLGRFKNISFVKWLVKCHNVAIIIIIIIAVVAIIIPVLIFLVTRHIKYVSFSSPLPNRVGTCKERL